MYRDPGTRSPSEEPPRTLVYPVVQRDTAGSASAMFRHFGLPPLGAVAVSALATPELGLAALAVGAGLSYASWRRAKRGEAVLLRVENGVLAIGPVGNETAKIPLAELTDVALDGKSIQRVQEGSSAIPAMRFIDAKVGPEIDIARIVLVRASLPDFPLTAERVAHMDATEWLGKIRVFLRKHGWVPEDEEL